MKNLFFLLAVAAFFLPAFTHAQVVQNTKEGTQNRVQIAANKSMIQRDTREIADFQMLIDRMDEALRDGDVASIQAMKQDILLAMKREIQQGEALVAQDYREVGQSKQEVRSDRLELHADRVDRALRNGDGVDDRVDTRRDRRDKRDDQRDVRNDQFDLNAQKARTSRQKVILETLTSHNFGTADAKMGLVREFKNIMKADLNALEKELAEDHREVREDRRERRDDRGERQERY